MGYRIVGRAHVGALRAQQALAARTLATRAALAGRTGQGTVEYVALILLVAGLFATVVVAAGGIKGDGIARAITDKIKSTIESVGAKQG